MKTITSNDELMTYCARAREYPFVTVDTEFLRERTYYPKLCLIQLAYPSNKSDSAVLIDPLATGLSLKPINELFADRSVVKVFHASRQDLEIFYQQFGSFPEPIFDTQLAAMVCGFGEQVGYEVLVKKIKKRALDKSSRFTDWSYRPLSKAQKLYALADVTHLRDIYRYLSKELNRRQRTEWLMEELQTLTNQETYEIRPEEAWQRIKARSQSPFFMAILRELAAFRETYAQKKNIPKAWVCKDNALIEIAVAKPKHHSDFRKLRLLPPTACKGEVVTGFLKAVSEGIACPNDKLPKLVIKPQPDNTTQALLGLLRVLLKAKAEKAGVSTKLIASSTELGAIAAGERNLSVLKGWRKEIFGNEAIKLCEGRIALSVENQFVKSIMLDIQEN
ncbi:MAG: ribonuclease D [Aestuariivita sp.]|nr:ribonuclease D [Aestuariivita sp.]